MVSLFFLFIPPTIGICHKSHNTPVPYQTMHHSEQKCAHLFSEKWIVGYGTGKLFDWCIRSIRIHVINVLVYLFMCSILSFHDYTQTSSGEWWLTFKISLVVPKIEVIIKRFNTVSMVAMKLHKWYMSCREKLCLLSRVKWFANRYFHGWLKTLYSRQPTYHFLSFMLFCG